jgi:non-heme chloroperoxidase
MSPKPLNIQNTNFKMPYLNLRDGTEMYYEDWGTKDAHLVVFSHGWPLTSDKWEVQMFFLANKGYRVIAHDRRGFGRSGQPWDGNNMDTYADDLNQLFESLDLKNAMLVGHSTGGGEVMRFLGRHGSSRVSKAVLIVAATPLLRKTENNPDGFPMEYYDGFLAALAANRSQLMLDVPSGPFYEFNRPGAKASQ